LPTRRFRTTATSRSPLRGRRIQEVWIEKHRKNERGFPSLADPGSQERSWNSRFRAVRDAIFRNGLYHSGPFLRDGNAGYPFGEGDFEALMVLRVSLRANARAGEIWISSTIALRNVATRVRTRMVFIRFLWLMVVTVADRSKSHCDSLFFVRLLRRCLRPASGLIDLGVVLVDESVNRLKSCNAVKRIFCFRVEPMDQKRNAESARQPNSSSRLRLRPRARRWRKVTNAAYANSQVGQATCGGLKTRISGRAETN